MLPRQGRAGEVLIVNSASYKPYMQAIEGLTQVVNRTSYQGVKTIQRAGIEIFSADLIQEDLSFNQKITQNQDQIIVAVGNRALAAVVDIPRPIIYLLVPRPAEIVKNRRNITGVALTVSPEKQLTAISKHLPFIKNLGLLYDPGKNATSIGNLQRLSPKETGFSLVSKEVTQPNRLKTALTEIGPTIDALLLVPDTTILTSTNQDILALFSLNQRKPLIAFAPQYLQHGASLVIYSSPQDMGKQAGQMVIQLLAGDSVEHIPPQPSQTITVKINKQILKKLGFKAVNVDKTKEGNP